jgi:alkylresorcinol/alkylpyrone synthase
VPQMVESHLRGDVDAFLADHGTSRAEIARFICHPGGPKVLEAMEEQLETPPGALDATWRSLEEVGNLSSTSVLLVMEETLEELRKEPPPQGEKALLLAMGPGFCSELVLLEAR